jgi:hypothetical protein
MDEADRICGKATARDMVLANLGECDFLFSITEETDIFLYRVVFEYTLLAFFVVSFYCG